MDTQEQKKKFLDALRNGLGIITTACQATGVSRSNFYYWCKNDEEFKAAADEIMEVQLDFVENKFLHAIEAGDITAMIFYLKTKGKKRGYSEKAIFQQKEKQKDDQKQLSDTISVTSAKVIERKVKSKKAYIVKLLKNQGKFTKELTYQVDITAKLLVRADMLGNEILAGGHKAVNVEYSREGNERVTVDPKEKLYLELLEKGQKALRALGMNTESKERKSDTDGFDTFYKALQEEKE